MTIKDLPTLNVILNFLTATMLTCGFWAIKSGKPQLHKKFMISAFCTATCFLASYLYYHFNTQLMTPYHGEGIFRYIYYTILFTHIPLAALSVPFVFAAFWYAFKKDFVTHTRITKWLWPTWIYVCITGILVYFMLYVF